MVKIGSQLITMMKIGVYLIITTVMTAKKSINGGNACS